MSETNAHSAGMAKLRDRIEFEAKHSNMVRNREAFSKEQLRAVAEQAGGVKPDGTATRKGYTAVITANGDLMVKVTKDELDAIKSMASGKKYQAPQGKDQSADDAARSKYISQLIAYNIDAVRNTQKNTFGAEALPEGGSRRIYLDVKKFLESAAKSSSPGVVHKALEVALDATRGRIIQEQINMRNRDKESGMSR